MVGAQKPNLISWLQCPSVGDLVFLKSLGPWDHQNVLLIHVPRPARHRARGQRGEEQQGRVWAILTAWRKGTHMGLGDVGSSPRVSNLSGTAAAGATSQRQTCRCFRKRLGKGTEPREVVALPSQLQAGAALVLWAGGTTFGVAFEQNLRANVVANLPEAAIGSQR